MIMMMVVNRFPVLEFYLFLLVCFTAFLVRWVLMCTGHAPTREFIIHTLQKQHVQTEVIVVAVSTVC